MLVGLNEAFDWRSPGLFWRGASERSCRALRTGREFSISAVNPLCFCFLDIFSMSLLPRYLCFFRRRHIPFCVEKMVDVGAELSTVRRCGGVMCRQRP